MKVFGEITSFHPDALGQLVGYLFTSPWIGLGVVTLTISMLIYLVSLTRLDMSFVLPMHAFSYVLNALMAWLILKEPVSLARWLAAIFISLGVFIVGWSKRIDDRKAQMQQDADPNIKSSWMLLLPLSFYLPKMWLGVLVLVLADCTADILVARGVKKIGKFSARSLTSILRWLKSVFVNPGVLIGVASYTVSFLMFISLLSWADISLVRPATGLGYIINLCGAHFILKEHISPGRLAGIIVIGWGVGIISLTG